MPHRFKVTQMPVTREAISLLAVDRCVSELRRGRMVAVRGSGGIAALVQAAEAATATTLQQLGDVAMSDPMLAITARRGMVLNLTDKDSSAIIIGCANGWRVQNILDLANPLSDFGLTKDDHGALNVKNVEKYGCETAYYLLPLLRALLTRMLMF
jgi:hypothetical protein